MTKRPATARPTSDVKRCAIYTRKSTSAGLEQEFNSLHAQYEACVAYVQRQGWSLVPTKYDDGGYTGANIDRPAFQRLLADIDAGNIDIVVVYKVDRLSRSLLDFAQVMDRLNTAGASFVSVTQNFSTADAMGRLTLNMLMSFAEFEREMIADRTRDKVAAARRKGKWTGGHIPFGYELKEKKLGVNELEARIIREAFELLLQHRQMSVVAHLLNDRGLVPRGAKLPAGKRPLWTKEGISRLLRNPLYAGFITQGGENCPGEHPAIIERETFEHVQDILGGGDRQTVHGGLNPEYLLRGLLHCGQCGSALTPASTKRHGQQYRYYRCSARNKAGDEACMAKPLPAGAIEKYVIERISGVAREPGFVADTRAALERRIAERRQTAEMLCQKLPGRIATLSAAAGKLAEQLPLLERKARELLAEKLNVESEKLAEAERQLTDAQRERESLRGVVAETEWVATALADFDTVWEALTVANRGRLLRALIDRVSVDEVSSKVEIQLVDFEPSAGAQQEAA